MLYFYISNHLTVYYRTSALFSYRNVTAVITLTSVQMQKNKKWRQCHYRQKKMYKVMQARMDSSVHYI